MEYFEIDTESPGLEFTLYDKIINVTFHMDDPNARGMHDPSMAGDKQYTVTCPAIGTKPDIGIHFETLPDHVCYGVTVKIKNFNVTFDIRNVKSMDIEAGYRTSFGGTKLVRTYHSPIFTSYRESPNPDGVTVFEGVIVGSEDDLYTNREIAINFHTKKVILKDLLRECVEKGFAGEIHSNFDDLDDDFKESEITTGRKYYRASNGYALIMWLSSTLDNYARNFYRVENGKKVFPYLGATTQLSEQQVTFHTIGASKKDGESWIYERQQQILNLDVVASAEFNAQTLNVTAPWNPFLTPDKYFFMKPNFFTGSNLPNSLNIDNLRSIDNVYKVITMSVDFETNGPANEMKIFGVPFNMGNTREVTEEAEKQRIIDQTIEDIALVINFGTPDKQAVTSGSNDWYNAPLPADTRGMFTYTVQPGDELNKIASLFYNSAPNDRNSHKGTMVNYTVPYSSLASGYSRATVPNPDPVRRHEESGVLYTEPISGTYFWPLIALYTYNAMLEDQKKPLQQRVGYRIDIQKPNDIEPGWRLLIPQIDGYKQPKGLGYYSTSKDVFKKMALQMVEAYPKYKDEEGVWRGYNMQDAIQGELAKLYIYLGGTSIV